MSFKVEVLGKPEPQGSKRAFLIRNTQRIVLVDQKGAELKAWRSRIAEAFAPLMDGNEPFRGPITLRIEFIFSRPRGHWGKRGLLPSAPTYKTTKPDIDKLVRGALDAMKGVVYVDDAQVVGIATTKGWAENSPEKTIIEVSWNGY